MKHWFRRHGEWAVVGAPALTTAIVIATSPYSFDQLATASFGDPAAGTWYTIAFFGLTAAFIAAQLTWRARQEARAQYGGRNDRPD